MVVRGRQLLDNIPDKKGRNNKLKKLATWERTIRQRHQVPSSSVSLSTPVLGRPVSLELGDTQAQVRALPIQPSLQVEARDP
jgi:hypothetical protein